MKYGLIKEQICPRTTICFYYNRMGSKSMYTKYACIINGKQWYSFQLLLTALMA